MKNNICFVGHRPNKFSFGYNENNIQCIKLKALLCEQIEDLYSYGYKVFLSGCALGVDIWCAEIVLDLKEIYKDMELYCIIPFEDHYKKWNENYKKRYATILEKCNDKLLFKKEYQRNCYLERNKFMINNSSILLSVYHKNTKFANSGTRLAIEYALSQKRKVKIVDPNLLKVFNVVDDIEYK